MVTKTSIYEKQAMLLARLLPAISREPDFALKGGTAINFFYRNLPRLSVDIDLAYLPIQNRKDTLLAISQALMSVIQRIRQELGECRIINKNNPENGMLCAFSVERDGSLVKVEPNLVIRGSVYGTKKRSLCESGRKQFVATVEMMVQSFPDLFGGKLCAALDRQHPRDLFDVKLLLENEGLTDEIRKAFIVYLISHSRPMNELVDPHFKDFKDIYNNEFIGMTRESVTLQDLLAVRDQLVKKIRSDLTSDERNFILSINELRPEWALIGLNGVEQLPAVQWKLQNLRKMSPKKHAEAIGKLKRCLEL